MLEDDLEFLNGLKEVALLGSGFTLRKVFAKMLLANSMSDPLNVWNQMWETLVDGLLYDRRIVLKSPGSVFDIFLKSYLFCCVSIFLI